jgi:putative acetyltransferase
MNDVVRIIDAHAPEYLDAVREIFVEYARSIQSHAASLNQQRFDAELATIPGRYAPPAGRILLAVLRAGDLERVAGCAALRPMPAEDPRVGPGCCELKRMYVRPEYRRMGLGRRLCERLIHEARAIGYRTMKLDTGEDFHAAIALYESMGFRPCPRFNDDPQPDTRWFERAI